MAQKQFTTYQSDILSFELREAMLGIAKPGRFQGWANMVSNGSPSGGLIPVRFNHGSPGFLKASHAPSPVLGSPMGIAVSTQGTIIHEDGDVDKSIAVNAIGSIRWDILYMEHIYVDSPGASTASYGIQQGVAGSGVPELLNPEKRIILGLIKIAASGSLFSSLTYQPKQSLDMFGDSLLAQKLWGESAKHHLGDIGTIPSDGLIGPRTYTEQNYITNYESLTTSLDKLDKKALLLNASITALNNKKLDDMAAPDDNTDLNVSIDKHGLTPKLPNDSSLFLNGTGGYTRPSGTVAWRGQIEGYQFSTGAGTINISSGFGAVQDLDCVALVGTYATSVIINVEIGLLGQAAVGAIGAPTITFSKGGSATDWQHISFPYLLTSALSTFMGSNIYGITASLVVPLSTDKKIRITNNTLGTYAAAFNAINVKIVGYF